MKHLDDDQLLKYILELLDVDEEKNIREHLAECVNCRQRLEKAKLQTYIIGNIQPDIDADYYPLPRVKRFPSVTLLKAAALILIGFFAGYGASRFSQSEPVNVVPQRIQVTSDEGSVTDFTICESVDITGGQRWKHNVIITDSLET